jgi:hypothetical protein
MKFEYELDQYYLFIFIVNQVNEKSRLENDTENEGQRSNAIRVDVKL